MEDVIENDKSIMGLSYNNHSKDRIINVSGMVWQVSPPADRAVLCLLRDRC